MTESHPEEKIIVIPAKNESPQEQAKKRTNAMRGMNTDEIWSANIPSTTDDSTGVSYVVALEDELAAMMERVDAGEDPRGPQTIGSTTDASATVGDLSNNEASDWSNGTASVSGETDSSAEGEE